METVVLLGVLLLPNSSAFAPAVATTATRWTPTTCLPTKHHHHLKLSQWHPVSVPMRIRQKGSRTKSSITTKLHLSSALSQLHGNTSYVLTFVLWLSTFGISLERRTTIGKALSAPLATMALALIVANLGLLPFVSPVCTCTAL